MPGTDARPPRPLVLVLAGTDPLGGAGLTQYWRTLDARGVDALCIPTAIVVQNSHGVQRFAPVAPALVADQIAAVLADCTPQAVVCSMLGSVEALHAITDTLGAMDPTTLLVVDPVLRGGTVEGAALAPQAMPRALCGLLHATRNAWVTPNVDELARLLDVPPAVDVEGLAQQARALFERTGACVLAKAGHLEPPGRDVLVTGPSAAACHRLDPHPAFAQALAQGRSVDVHGTGCRLAAELTAALLAGCPPLTAAHAARDHLATAVRDTQRRVGTGRPQLGWKSGGDV